MKVLAVGDVCGQPGIEILSKRLGSLRKETGADLVIVNGENACLRGISPSYAERIFDAGADIITLGNHTYDNRQICDYLDEHRYIIRPMNMPAQRPGVGYVLIDCLGKRVCVINLIGRVNMDYNVGSPFAASDEALASIDADLFIVDFHAEASSEKQAMGYHLDGRASVMFGTHTHVPTADEHVYPGGLGFISDIGMTGGIDSIIGVKAEQSLGMFRGELPPRFEASDRNVRIQGALFELGADGKCIGVSRINTD